MALLAALIFALPKPVQQLDSLFYEGHYAELLEFADSIVRTDSGVVKLQALKFQAFAYIAMDSIELAESCFVRLLNENPYFELDPIYTFPKAMQAFQSAKVAIGATAVPTLDSIRNILRINDSLGLELRRRRLSLFFPGLGDYKFGDKKRGRTLMALTLLNLGAIGLSHVAYLRAKDRYMRAQNQVEIDSAYKTMDMWYKLRILSVISLFGIYFYAQF